MSSEMSNEKIVEQAMQAMDERAAAILLLAELREQYERTQQRLETLARQIELQIEIVSRFERPQAS